MKILLSLPACLAGIFVIYSSFRTTKAANDVHDCWDSQKKVVEEFGRAAPSYHWFPKCLPGGYWQNVQCGVNGCYCAYVDTGLMIPNTIQNALLRYMKEHCPILSAEMPDACSLPPTDYPCTKTSRRFYYNRATGRCEASGKNCLGFRNATACKNACVVETRDRCNFRENKGRKCQRRGAQERWYHDEGKGQCRPFMYAGCGGNSNNYREKWQCLKTCEYEQDEQLIIQVGKTKYIIRLPTWMVVLHLLVPSANNVLTVDQFKKIEGYMVEISKFPVKDEAREGKPTPSTYWPKYAQRNQTKRQICSMPPKPGPCRAFIPRWYLDGSKSKCVKFIYGGCHPNSNHFQTATQCADFCDAKIKPSEADILEGMILMGPVPLPGPTPTDKPTGERSLELGPPDKEGSKDAEILGEEEIEIVIGGGSSDPAA